jgi:uncharacterized protein YjbI with pentapeptide repeats
MANEEHLKILKRGVEQWNKWRLENAISPDLGDANLNRAKMLGADLSGADLSGASLRYASLFRANLMLANLIGANLRDADLIGADLSGADLSGADLSGADLSGADLHGANLNGANLSDANLFHADLTDAKLRGASLADADLQGAYLTHADLTDADLSLTRLVETDFTNATITGCRTYGASAWNVTLVRTVQDNLVITKEGEPVVTVDDLEMAQFIYLLLKNQKLRDVIHTIGQKGVLILGRFSPPERKEVLDKIRDRVRELGYLPVMFDFERATEKDFTETIKILAGLSLFVIVDLTNPKSAPLELQATIPDYKIPFVPIIQKGEKPFAMFKDLNAYPWVIKPVMSYDSKETLVAMLEKAVIKPAIKKHNELVHVKAKDLEIEDISDFS